MSNTIEEALEDLEIIRTSLAASETFRGYRSASVGCTAILAFAGSYVQRAWPEACMDLLVFLSLWIPIACLSVILTFGEVLFRYWKSGPVLRRLTRSATTPMIPSLVAGVMLTSALTTSAPELGWMLPGLWSVLFGLGVFASARYLPHWIHCVAIYYVVVGTICVAWGPDGSRIPFWSMGLSFGVGQLLGSVILFRSLEYRV